MRMVVRAVQPVNSDASLCERLSLEAPQIGFASNSFGLRLLGWFIGKQPLDGFRVYVQDQTVGRFDPVPRLDVAALNPAAAPACVGGFEMVVPVPALDREVTVSLCALCGEAEVLEVQFALRINPRALTYTPSRQPILMTSGGRVGSTAMMQLLAAHPDIVVAGAPPYEVKQALYALDQARVRSNPADRVHSTRGLEFEELLPVAGSSPFGTTLSLGVDNVETYRWFNETEPDLIFNQAAEMIDGFYAAVADDQSKTSAEYFAEKTGFGWLPFMAKELYEDVNEVMLIRDPRDMLASIFRFNEKRQLQSFHAKNFESDRDYIDFMGKACRFWIYYCEINKRRSFLMRYEDLVSRPNESAKELFSEWGIDDSDDAVYKSVFSMSKLTQIYAQHLTSNSAQSSIGGWRETFTPDQQGMVQEAMSDIVEYFGYAKD